MHIFNTAVCASCFLQRPRALGAATLLLLRQLPPTPTSTHGVKAQHFAFGSSSSFLFLFPFPFLFLFSRPLPQRPHGQAPQPTALRLFKPVGPRPWPAALLRAPPRGTDGQDGCGRVGRQHQEIMEFVTVMPALN